MKNDETIMFTVRLNGTGTNPWHGLGLTQNPFPELARHEYAGPLLHLARLGGDPIPDVAFIREYLAGWSQEFIELCCERFRPGEMVEFKVFVK